MYWRISGVVWNAKWRCAAEPMPELPMSPTRCPACDARAHDHRRVDLGEVRVEGVDRRAVGERVAQEHRVAHALRRSPATARRTRRSPRPPRRNPPRRWCRRRVTCSRSPGGACSRARRRSRRNPTRASRRPGRSSGWRNVSGHRRKGAARPATGCAVARWGGGQAGRRGWWRRGVGGCGRQGDGCGRGRGRQRGRTWCWWWTWLVGVVVDGRPVRCRSGSAERSHRCPLTSGAATQDRQRVPPAARRGWTTERWEAAGRLEATGDPAS